jgi:hypothetical protein
MATKLLAGVVAALLATGAGVYVAFSGYTTTETAAGNLPVSEGSCCAAKAKPACCDATESEADGCDGCPLQAEACRTACTPDALAACTGSAALAAPPQKACPKAGCCGDQ